MSEQSMIELAQAALDDNGIDDRIIAVGQFSPRGRSGSMFAGGMLGSSAGGALGEAVSGIGLGAGVIGGAAANPPRAGLTATVHQRVNVRVLELIQDETGARIELEGSRLPVTHAKDVMDVLTARSSGGG